MKEFLRVLERSLIIQCDREIKSITLPEYLYSKLCADCSYEDKVYSINTYNGYDVYFTSKDKIEIELKDMEMI